MNLLDKQIFEKLKTINASQLVEKTYTVGDSLFLQGEVVKKVFFVESGLLKSAFINSDGKEYIKWFVPENTLVGCSSSLTENKASTFNMICLEKTTVFSITIKNFYELLKSDHELTLLTARFAFHIAGKKEQREYDFLSKSPETRYIEFRREYPGLIQRLPIGEIAKYLGITNVALSRIRSRLTNK